MAEKRSGFTPGEQARIDGILTVVTSNLDEYATGYDHLLAVGHTPVEAVLHLSDQLNSVRLTPDELVRELSVAVRTIHDLREQLKDQT